MPEMKDTELLPEMKQLVVGMNQHGSEINQTIELSPMVDQIPPPETNEDVDISSGINKKKKLLVLPSH